MNNWHQLDTTEVLDRLGTQEACGLSQSEASHRLAKYGGNELTESPPKSVWQMLWEQLTATTVLVLIAAAAIAAFLGDSQDTVAILVIVIFNAALGLNQDYRAGRAFAALKRLAVPTVKVCREGKWQQFPSSELVPGDVIRLETGDFVPADCRLLESIGLQVQEAAFTGESVPVQKNIRSLPASDSDVSACQNMVYLGTAIASGRGKAVVTETGMATELGKIARAVQTAEPEQTPLQERLDVLGKRLAIATLLLVLVILGLGLLRGESFYLMVLTAVSMAVAVIPEGLPAVVTIALAIGSRRMLQQRALIRKLPAVETLGSVTTICSDKTGTLTENRMTAAVLSLPDRQIDLRLESLLPAPLDPALDLLLTAITLCNNAILPEDRHPEATDILGDPTEIALLVAAASLEVPQALRSQQLPRIAEIPFNSDRKCMTTIHEFQHQSSDRFLEKLASTDGSSPYIAFTKGAFSAVSEVCNRIWIGGRTEPLNAAWRGEIEGSDRQLAQTGMRVLAVAFRWLDRALEAEAERDLIFLGLVGEIDPIRPAAQKAVEICQHAGIRPAIVTGDHPLTAKQVATELGIDCNTVLTGADLNQLTLKELEDRVESISVYARVSPQQKLKIVEALQNKGHIVAMTGDGVNDAPALKKADIGVAMGITGTDVAKEAADMVLLDDNFATIVATVREGRVIYDNIRKFIKYSMTGNASGVWIMLLAPFLDMPLPLLPLQILWINLLADGLLALALSVEPAESDAMHRPPYSPKENVFSRGVGRDILWVGGLVGFAILLLGYGSWSANLTNWQTTIFVTLAFSRMSLALAMRSQRDSLFQIGLFSNPYMLWAAIATFILQLAAIYIPGLQEFFHTAPLSPLELGICLGVSTVGFWGVELEKWFLRRRSSNIAIP